ncbi:MAG: hypothetical protein A3J66_01610 [Candidatus Magasanikbacteria bacterium RIFCSPHIGHO2_02_FULL_47_14]|uniref:Uncharacterized protein n=1 Tax=Candidatus Magasanikbacteria bacterium RIFCSPHIGHO2_02_FULL_47_14 TaxID=1798680 RepID=A0A1F6LYT5_9BACT|nr:MAG: hypothetical protein A3J66_01610 [Candidatus Magasanikbacteria bacterium RIFCSPHIGHO2_02_FULL_47_14]
MRHLRTWLGVATLVVGFLVSSQDAQALCVHSVAGAADPACVDGAWADTEEKCLNLCRDNPVRSKCTFKLGSSCAEFRLQLKRFEQTQKQLNSEFQQTFNAPFPDVASLNRLGASSTPQEVIGRAIGIVMQIMGTIALVVLVYAGVTWMTAGGNADKERKALETMFWGGLGVIVILSGYAIVKFILDHTFL